MHTTGHRHFDPHVAAVVEARVRVGHGGVAPIALGVAKALQAIGEVSEFARHGRLLRRGCVTGNIGTFSGWRPG